jgi:hypothetical protein
LDYLGKQKPLKVVEAVRKYECFCMVPFKQEDKVRMLPDCGHVFHVDCIDRWLREEKCHCPIDKIKVDYNKSLE